MVRAWIHNFDLYVWLSLSRIPINSNKEIKVMSENANRRDDQEII